MFSNRDHHNSIRNLGSPIATTGYLPQCEEAVAMDELPVGAVIEVDTGHHTYLIENCGKGKVLISGHPDYCPEPVLVDLHGSVGRESPFKMLIEPGTRMEFEHPTFGVVRTSPVREVRELMVGAPS